MQAYAAAANPERPSGAHIASLENKAEQKRHESKGADQKSSDYEEMPCCLPPHDATIGDPAPVKSPDQRGRGRPSRAVGSILAGCLDRARARGDRSAFEASQNMKGARI